MRIVLDTNVLIAAFITRGVCSDVLEHCALRHTLVTSEFILGELVEHLRGKFGYSEKEVARAVGMLCSRADVVEPVNLGEPVCRDADDDAVLGTAIAGKAAYIVTGDHDLLVLKRFRGVEIMRPAEFVENEDSS